MKTKGILSVLLIVGFAVFLNGCSFNISVQGDGKVVSQERKTHKFYGVVLDGAGDVNIHFSEHHRVVVTTDSNVQDYVVIRVDGDFLHIDMSNNDMRACNTTEMTIDVYLPCLETIRLKGTGNIKISGGTCSDLEIVLSGTGNIDARNCESENVNVNLSGTGDVRVWATKSLTGKLSGTGDIRYRGNPSTKSITRTGVGEVSKLY